MTELAGERARVLLTNDDGIEAEGLRAVAEALRPHADLTIVAPNCERSATGHAITIFNDLQCEPYHRDGMVWGWGLNGTPADCVKIATTIFGHDRPFDLVISGINHGQNTGINILYSGTVAAAREAAIMGLPAMAISLSFKDSEELQFDTAARIGVEVFKSMCSWVLPHGVMLNVNVPSIPYERIKGWTPTRMGNSTFVDHFLSRSPKEIFPAIYRNVGKGWTPSTLESEDFDDRALLADQVSITPLQFDLTAHEFLPSLGRWLPGNNGEGAEKELDLSE